MTANSVTLFNNLYLAHENLKAVETERHKDQEARTKHAKDKNLKQLASGKRGCAETPAELEDHVVKKMRVAWELGRNDPNSLDAEYNQREQALLHAIGASVRHYVSSGSKIAWEATNAQTMILFLKRQLNEIQSLHRPELKPLLQLFEQDIATHQDQFSRNFYLCAKEQSEGKNEVSEVAQTCVKLFCDLRAKIGKVATAKQAKAKTIDNRQIRTCIKLFVEAFKEVKERMIAISIAQAESNLSKPFPMPPNRHI